MTHGLLPGNAGSKLDESPIVRLFVTDSVETRPGELSNKVGVVSVAPLREEAIRRIAQRQSISALFN